MDVAWLQWAAVKRQKAIIHNLWNAVVSRRNILSCLLSAKHVIEFHQVKSTLTKSQTVIRQFSSHTNTHTVTHCGKSPVETAGHQEDQWFIPAGIKPRSKGQNNDKKDREGEEGVCKITTESKSAFKLWMSQLELSSHKSSKITHL